MASNSDDRLQDEENLDCNFMGDFSEQHENQEEDNNSRQVHYSNRVYSLHRHGMHNNQKHLLQSYEARSGGASARTMVRNRQAGQSENFIEEHANLIVSKMEQDPTLMENSLISEDLRREALRDMPQCLTLKRCVKVKLLKSVSQKSKRRPIGCWKRFKYRNSFLMSRLKLSMKNVLYSLELWYGALKQIEGNFGSGVGSFFKFLRWIFVMNLLIAIVSFVFIVLPQIVSGQTNNSTMTAKFDWMDLLTGEGYFTNSIMYYGFYSNQTVSLGFMSYSMPHAYFFTMACIYLSCLAFFSISAASSYRKSFIETEGGLKNAFAHKIFCGWDYTIATEDAAVLKSRAIYNELRELLSDAMKNKSNRSCLEIFWTRTMQISMNLLIVISLTGTGYLMWFLMNNAYEEQWTPIYASLAVNAIMTVFPIAFSWIVKYEDYGSPKNNLYLTLIRTFALGFVTIGVLLSFWLKKPNNNCWETSLGQEVYRLILFDFLFAVIISPLLDLMVYALFRYFHQGHLHFDISRSTMQIIYNQSLLWVGLLFSPLLPLLVTIKLFILWYVKQVILLKFCKPSSKSWRAAQTTAWFLMMALLGLLLVGGLIGYIITNMSTTTCGPFSGYDYIYEIVTLGVLNLRKNSNIFRILLFVTKPGFIALIMIALCARVYYMRAKAHAQRGIVALYRDMLVWESRDKEFLLQNISHITKGQWQYKLQEGRELDPIISSPTISNYKTDENGDSIIREPSSFDLLKLTPSTSFTGPSASYSGSELDTHSFSQYKKLS